MHATDDAATRIWPGGSSQCNAQRPVPGDSYPVYREADGHWKPDVSQCRTFGGRRGYRVRLYTAFSCAAFLDPNSLTTLAYVFGLLSIALFSISFELENITDLELEYRLLFYIAFAVITIRTIFIWTMIRHSQSALIEQQLTFVEYYQEQD